MGLAIVGAGKTLGEVRDQLGQLVGERLLGELHRLVEASPHPPALQSVQIGAALSQVIRRFHRWKVPNDIAQIVERCRLVFRIDQVTQSLPRVGPQISILPVELLNGLGQLSLQRRHLYVKRRNVILPNQPDARLGKWQGLSLIKIHPRTRVVREFESQGEQAVRDERQLLEEHDRFQRAEPQALCEEDRNHVMALGSDIPALWHATTVNVMDRQTIIGHLIERIDINVQGKREYVDVAIHWAGGYPPELTTPQQRSEP